MAPKTTKILRIEGYGSKAFKAALLNKIAEHVVAVHDKVEKAERKPKRRKAKR